MAQQASPMAGCEEDEPEEASRKRPKEAKAFRQAEKRQKIEQEAKAPAKDAQEADVAVDGEAPTAAANSSAEGDADLAEKSADAKESVSEAGDESHKVPETSDAVSEEVARPAVARWFGTENIQLVTAALTILFLILFGMGLAMPVMILYLDSNLLLQPRGPLDPSMKPIIDTLHIEDLVNSEVTIFSATSALAAYIASGELNDIFAVVMLTVFVMALPIANMFCLLGGAWHLRSKEPDTAAAWQFLRHSKWLKHISMLDVFIMGIIVVTAAGSAYSQQGVLFGVMIGLWILLLAEATHYFTHYQVHDVYNFLEKSATK